MLTLKVEIPEARDRTAFATLRDGMRTIATGPAVASATPAFAAQHANPKCDSLRPCGHPPLGRYSLLNHEPAQPAHAAQYGAHLLLFQPESGQALDAESFGRLALLVFGGPPGRRTHGGLRLGNEMMKAVVTRLSGAGEMTLDLVPLRPRAWWQFWKTPQPPSQPLTVDALNPPQPPHDELTLLEALLQKSVRRVRDTARDSDDAFDRDTRRDTSSTSSSGDSFQGKGGASGGAGASGRWDESAGRGSGVDSAGRIIAGAAVVGAVAAAAAAMAHNAEAETGGGAESSAGGSDADTTTSTAY